MALDSLSDSESEVSNGDVQELLHNINWMYSAFRSRSTAETLLSPERESGNLTTHDYDATIQFLSSTTHRYYPVRSLPSLWIFLRSHLASLFSVP